MARPRTLWLALLFELWRLVLLTAAVVVGVVAFAVAVRPLADGRLEPVETVRFMLYAVVPMLQYALPFAGGFAATLVYHRLASDNELTAVYAGGVSHRAALVPALLTGLVLSGSLLVLADQVMPRFLRTMQTMITRDATRLMVSSIEKGQSVKLGRRQVFADKVQALGPDAASGAFERLVLTGVLAVETGDNDEVIREASARAAMVWLYRGAPRMGGAAGATGGLPARQITGMDASQTTIVLQLRDSIGQSKDVGLSEVEESTLVYVVPAGFGDDPKYHSWRSLQEMKRRPEMNDVVDRHRRMLATAIAERDAAERIGSALSKEGKVEFLDTVGRRVTLRGVGLGGFDAARGWSVEPRITTGLVEVETRLSEGGKTRLQRAKRAWVAAPVSADEGTSTVAIHMEEVAGVGAGSVGEDPTPVSGELTKWTISRLRPETDPLPELLGLSAAEMLERGAKEMTKWPNGQMAKSMRVPGDAARESATAGGRVDEAWRGLDKELTLLLREIVSKQNERIAYAAACCVMVLCGGVMAMRLGQAMPLTVYLWSFLPAVVCILTISGGQRTAHFQGPLGLAVLWGGVAALAVFTLWEYRQLARH
ncbi:MAG: LptF/LptG family permease [Phycisphaerales bacterium]